MQRRRNEQNSKRRRSKRVKEEEENEEEIKENEEEEEEVEKEEVIEKLRDNGVDFNEIESNEKLRELLYASPNYCFFLLILSKKKKRKTIEVSNKLINAFLSEELCKLFKKIKKIITPPQKIASTRPFTLAKAVHPELNLEEIRNNVKNNMKSLDKIIEGIDICRRNGLFVFPQWTEGEK